MEAKKFSCSEAFKFGWETVKNNFGFFIGLTIIYGLIIFVPSGIAESLKKTSTALYILTAIIASVINTIVHMGLVKILLNFHDGKNAKISDLFSCASLFLKYATGSILYALIAVGGMLLLIVPGIIWMVQFSFCGYIIVDKMLGPIAALKRSSAITKGVKWQLFIFSLLFFGINILGMLALFVGLLVTLPLTMLAAVFVYRKLLIAAGPQANVQPAVI
jgi:uncharacterized membrane protein